jgi:iron complex transport system substrate-binding protein
VRIASLLPAATEIAPGPGPGESLVAVTFECDARDRVPVVLDTATGHGPAPAGINA